MVDPKTLYRVLGQKIRDGRDRAGKFSQEKLARHLNVSRASIVNIEAGRQHAPLHVLWQIAEVLGMDLAALLPRRSELTTTATVIELNDTMRKQIAHTAKGNTGFQEDLTNLVSKMLTTIDNTPNSDTP